MEEKSKKIRYYINGNCIEVSIKISLQSALCGNDDYTDDSIIALNGVYMNSHEEYETIQISEGDKIEIINLLAGG
jgi:sulfur carrier protein ThiS